MFADAAAVGGGGGGGGGGSGGGKVEEEATVINDRWSAVQLRVNNSESLPSVRPSVRLPST